MDKLISVITPTCSRTDVLLRAVRTVKNQTYPNIQHIIVGDAHPTLSAFQAEILKVNPSAVIVNLNTSKEVLYPAQRASTARNFGIQIAEGELVAQLDDDNELEPAHYTSLVETIEQNRVEAAYSWRKLLYPDGQPAVVRKYPWAIDPYLSEYVFGRLVQAGIFTPGSCEVHDQMITPDGDPILHVDTSEWLMTKKLALKIPFATQYTLRQMIQHHTEDYVLATEFHRQGIRTACSERATLLYYLGGYSNEGS